MRLIRNRVIKKKVYLLHVEVIKPWKHSCVQSQFAPGICIGLWNNKVHVLFFLLLQCNGCAVLCSGTCKTLLPFCPHQPTVVNMANERYWRLHRTPSTNTPTWNGAVLWESPCWYNTFASPWPLSVSNKIFPLVNLSSHPLSVMPGVFPCLQVSPLNTLAFRSAQTTCCTCAFKAYEMSQLHAWFQLFSYRYVVRASWE